MPNYVSKLTMADSTEYLIKDLALTSRVDALEVAGFEAKVYTTLPTASANTMHIIALVQETGTTSGIYTEYVTVRSGEEGAYTYTWEKIGTTKTDLTDYLRKDDITTSTGKVTITSEGHTHTYDKTSGLTYTSTSANLSIGDISYTPDGSVDITGVGVLESGLTSTGISATPVHTSTALSLSDAGHTHGVGTLSGTVGTGVTLTANTATATGRIQYVQSATFSANTPTAVTLPTYTAGSVVMPTRAQHAVMSDTYTYDSANETLIFTSENIYEMTSAGSYTAPQWTDGSVTAGTSASYTPTVRYLSSTLASGTVTITGSVASGNADVSGSYDKTTSIGIVDGGHSHSVDGDRIAALLTAAFTGTEATLSPTGTVSYDKATGFTYTSTDSGSTATGKAGTYNVTGGSVVVITP